MKVIIFFFSLILISTVNNIDWRDVMNDFSKPFDNARFCKNVVFIQQDYQNNLFDTTFSGSKRFKKNGWLKINAVMGRCDYIVTADSASVDCFFIHSDKAYPEFWVKYENNKIAIIKMITPAIFEHLIPPPCGY